MNEDEAINVAWKAMEDAIERSGGDPQKLMEEMRQARKDPTVREAYRTIGQMEVEAEESTKH